MASISARVEAQGSAIRRPTTFLSLAPTLGASYPAKDAAKPATSSSSSSSFSAALAQKGTFAAPPMSRSSSSYSTASSSSTSSAGSRQLRFLKLGPVHHGQDDGTGDWSEVYDEVTY